MGYDEAQMLKGMIKKCVLNMGYEAIYTIHE